MKRVLALLVFAAALWSCAMADAEYDYVGSGGLWLGDDTLQQYCLEHFDEDQDGTLSKYELSLVRTLDCSGMGIRRLPLEYFPNLDTLLCAGNNLVSLDLNDIPNLRCLNCSENFLTDLNVSVTKVDELYCNPMSDTGGANLLQYVYVRRSQKIEGVTYSRSSTVPKRVPDDTLVVAVPD